MSSKCQAFTKSGNRISFPSKSSEKKKKVVVEKEETKLFANLKEMGFSNSKVFDFRTLKKGGCDIKEDFTKFGIRDFCVKASKF